jgi:hypothetical protein
VQCTRCLKPNVRHRAIPDATFTILVSCQHGTEDDVAENRFPNRSVAAILPYAQRQFTCLGNLVVVKHSLPAPDTPSASNADLPIVDLEPADFPFVDEMVARSVVSSLSPPLFISSQLVLSHPYARSEGTVVDSHEIIFFFCYSIAS